MATCYEPAYRRAVPARLCLVVLLCTGIASLVGAQATSEPARGGLSPGDVDQPLPLTDVVLFTSGVGFFQRGGVVVDDALVELAFKTQQVSDLLKSMVVRDFDGGVVSGVSYSSRSCALGLEWTSRRR